MIHTRHGEEINPLFVQGANGANPRYGAVCRVLAAVRADVHIARVHLSIVRYTFFDKNM